MSVRVPAEPFASMGAAMSVAAVGERRLDKFLNATGPCKPVAGGGDWPRPPIVTAGGIPPAR